VDLVKCLVAKKELKFMATPFVFEGLRTLYSLNMCGIGLAACLFCKAPSLLLNQLVMYMPMPMRLVWYLRERMPCLWAPQSTSSILHPSTLWRRIQESLLPTASVQSKEPGGAWYIPVIH